MKPQYRPSRSRCSFRPAAVSGAVISAPTDTNALLLCPHSIPPPSFSSGSPLSRPRQAVFLLTQQPLGVDKHLFPQLLHRRPDRSGVPSQQTTERSVLHPQEGVRTIPVSSCMSGPDRLLPALRAGVSVGPSAARGGANAKRAESDGESERA